MKLTIKVEELVQENGAIIGQEWTLDASMLDPEKMRNVLYHQFEKMRASLTQDISAYLEKRHRAPENSSLI